MSIFTLDWFKSKKVKEVKSSKPIENFTNSISNKKLYKKLQIVNDTITVVFVDGSIVTKQDCNMDDFENIKICKSESEILKIFKTEIKSTISNLELTVSKNYKTLESLADFEVDGNSIKLKGTNRTIPIILLDKFITIVDKWKNCSSEDLQSACDNDEEYKALKRFFMWCCLNPRAEVADELYRFLTENSFRITKQGFFVALRNVVTVHGSNELVKFISEVYTKIKAVWKKSPNDYRVILLPDGTYTFMHYDKMFTNQEEKCDTCDGTGEVWDDETESWETCYECNGAGSIIETTKNYEGTNLGCLTDLYLDLPNRAENRFTDDWTKTFDIRIGQIVDIPMNECNWSTQDCAAAGLHFTADQINYVGCGDQSVLMLINPMKVVGIGTAKGRCYEYLPISTVSREDATQILHDLDFDSIDLDEFYLESQLESLAEKAQLAFADEATKHQFNIPSISTDEIGNIVNLLNKIKHELEGRVKNII